MTNFIKHKFVEILILFTLFCAYSFNHIEVQGGASDQKAVVFLIEVSDSMQKTNKNDTLLNDIIKFSYSLPSNYHIGAIAYNSEIDTVVNIYSSSQRSNLITGFNKFKYNGYCDTSIALEKAFNMLSEFYSYDKNIIIISDGDIALANNAQTSDAYENFQAVYDEFIDNKTKLHRIKIGNTTIDDDIVYDAVANSGGRNYIAETVSDIDEVFDDILKNNFLINKHILLETQSTEELTELKFKLPFESYEPATLLITSSSDILNINPNIKNIENLELIQSGSDYAVFNSKNLGLDDIFINIETDIDSDITVEYIPEYEIEVVANITYIDTIPKNKEQELKDRTAEITLSFFHNNFDIETENPQIFTDSYFNDTYLEINDKLTGESMILPLVDGYITYSIDVYTYEHKTVGIDLSSIPIYISNNVIFNIELEEPPKIPNYILISAVSFICFIIIGLVVSKIIKISKKVQDILDFPAVYEKEGEFIGRLNIYITKSSINSNIPPLTLNLLRLEDSNNTSLEYILDLLNISEKFIGSDKIIFAPSTEKILVLTNNSNCKITKNNVEIKTKTNTKLDINSEIDIIFEDEKNSITLQYKDMIFKKNTDIEDTK